MANANAKVSRDQPRSMHEQRRAEDDIRRQVAILWRTRLLRNLRIAVDDEIWNAAATHFDDSQMGGLILAISTINVWNRIAISTQMEPPVDEKNPLV